MLFIKIILWIIAIIFSGIFSISLWYFIERKFSFWNMERKVRKMAKKYKDEETKSDLTELADDMRDYRKNDSIDNILEDE